ncbi:MAG: ABC transporter ATP-binding protein [Lachnospiraceae bacterium]|nr:ABC transporter ATP-binding protein [Lachnospiraceae bacterium]
MELKLDGIRKSYNRGKTYAVEDFSVDLTPGIYGLLGPNGAGKSTLMNIITQNLNADEGTISLDGVEITKLGAEYRKVLGYMPQQQGIYDDFTGEMFLWYMAALKGLGKKEAKQKIDELFEVVNLQEARHKKMKTYSGGMKQRILIAQALLNDPKILIMDEPTAGLDPKERIRIRNFISDISKDKIVLLATHVVSDVEFIAKEILVMNGGYAIARGTTQELLGKIEDKVFEVLVTPEEQGYYDKEEYKISNVAQTLGKVSLRIVSDTIPDVGQVRNVSPNLEDLYLYLVG